MPIIQDYSAPETQGSGPVGAITPNVEAAGRVGRAIEDVGQAVTQYEGLVHRREVQKESSTIYADVADARTKFTEGIQAQASNPNFDTEKFDNQFSDWADKQRSKYTTPEGVDYFNRQATRLKGTMLQTAMKQQSITAAYKARADMQGGLNSAAATLSHDPDQWQDIMAAQDEFIHNQAEHDPKLGPQIPMLQAHARDQIAMAALRGMMRLDPGSAANDRIGAAQKELETDSELARALTPQNRLTIQREADAWAKGEDATQKAQGKAQEAQDKSFMQQVGNQNYTKLMSNQLTAQDVMKMQYPDGRDVEFQEKQFWIKQIDEHAKEGFKSNPVFRNQIANRIFSDPDTPGHISDPSELRTMVGPNKLSINDFGELSRFINKDPAKIQEHNDEKALMKMANAGIVKQGLLNNGKDPITLQKLQMFQSDYLAAKAQQIAAHKPVADLLDPTKPEYFGNKLNAAKYQTSIQEQSQAMRQQREQAVIQKAPPEQIIKPGENAVDLIRRLKKAKGG